MAAGISGDVRKGNCEPTKPTKGVYYTQVSRIIDSTRYTWAYGRNCAGSRKCQDNAQQHQYFRSSDDCKVDPKDAVSMVTSYLSGQISGYPKIVTDLLEVGDWFYTYAGNSECDGMHSQIFLGWHESKKGVAWIFDGDIKNNPRIRERCLTNNCGRYAPITRIYRPNFAADGVWMFAD